jgi:hypothetical protein
MKPKSKTQVEAQAQAQGSAVEPTVKVEAPSVVGPLGAYADELARASDILDAKARADGKQLPDSTAVRNKLFDSLTLFLRASGVPEAPKLTKPEMVEWRDAHDEYRAAVRADAAILATIGGKSAEVTRFTGKRKYGGFDSNGTPTRWEQGVVLGTGMTLAEKKAFWDEAITRANKVKATLA